MPYYMLNTFDDYDTLIQNNPNALILLDFTSKRCGPCARILPIFTSLSDEVYSKIFCKVDVDENQELSRYFNISAMPTFILVKNDTVISRFSGASIERLQNMAYRT
jgi:thioredoxin 1